MKAKCRVTVLTHQRESSGISETEGPGDRMRPPVLSVLRLAISLKAVPEMNEEITLKKRSTNFYVVKVLNLPFQFQNVKVAPFGLY